MKHVYVFDTNVFRELGRYYPSRFLTLWKKLNADVAAGVITSVREVRREMKGYKGETTIQDWVKENAAIFGAPTRNEQIFVRKLLEDNRGQMLVKKKKLLGDNPAADPWIIAKAHSVRGGIVPATGVVVTMEGSSAPAHNPNTTQGKIPDVCRGYGIKCMNLEKFMTERDWVF